MTPTHRSLVAPQLVGLLKDGKAPTAIRAQYYRYTFTDPGESDWWKRQRVRGDTPKIILPSSALGSSMTAKLYRSPPHRAWMLLLSTCGAVMAVTSLQVAACTAPSHSRVYWVVIMSTQCMYCVATFGAALLQDYPELRTSLGLASFMDTFGLRLSPNSWQDYSTGYASVFGLSAAQALGLLSVGLKLRAADCVELSVGVRNEQQLPRRHGHTMDSHLLLSSCLAAGMMVISKHAGDFNETLFQ